MDRACVQRARHLRERIGFVDRATTYKEFADFVEERRRGRRLRQPSRRAGSAAAHRHRPHRPPDVRALRRAVQAHGRDRRRRRCRSQRRASACRIGPTSNIDLAYEHGRAQNAIQNLRNAYVELLDSFFSAAPVASATRPIRCAPSSRRSPAGSATTSTAAPTSTGRKSFLLRLQEKRASLTDIRERFLGLKNDLPADGEAQRLVAPGDRQARSHHRRRRRADRSARQGDVGRYAARRGRQRHHALGRLQHHDGRADRQPVARADRRAPGRQRQARRRRAGRPHGGDGPRHLAHPRAHQRGAAQQRVPRLRARAVDARSDRAPGAGAHRRA